MSARSMLLLAFLTGGPLVITSPVMAQETITPLISKGLAGVSGKDVLIYTVDFPAGYSSPVHRHDAQLFLYVLEGSIVTQLKGGKEITLTQGQIFFEDPNDIHTVSRNASSTQPAKLLVFMVKKKGAPPLILER